MPNLRNHVAHGVLAGAAGTTALDAVTYADMAVRGRPASSTPEATVERMAGLAGMWVPGRDDSERQSRTSGLGSLMGAAAGVGSGALIGAIRASGRPRSWAGTAVLACSVTMLAGNAPMAGLGVSDPRQWKPADWAADLVPHAAYAAVTATVLRQLDEE